LPESPSLPPEGYVGESLNDALDDLLREAAASLKHLDGIRSRLPKAKNGRRHDSSDFWRPRCRAELWSEADFNGELDSEDDSDLSSHCSAGDIDAEEENLWEFLRSACNSAGTRSADRARKTSAGASPRPPLPKAKAQPRWSNTSEAPPRAADKPAERARRQGFQFGAYSAGTDAYTPEAQVSVALKKAQAEGAEAVKGELRKLLLKWHPDKAPQGDSPGDVAARAESTRVLRYVLQEKKRLGI
jgi:hypothetical protein